jgi:hypothetical protein
MTAPLTEAELVHLVRRVFQRHPDDRGLAVLVDLPDEHTPDNAGWAARRAMAAGWAERLDAARGELGLERVSLVLYRNVRRNNADLPARAHIHAGGALPQHAAELPGEGTPFEELYARHQILVAPTEFSATAPLKLAAPAHRFRAATMPGFSDAMVPALRLDWMEIHSRCRALKEELDAAEGAEIATTALEEDHLLYLDLRHRAAHASGGMIAEPGVAGNLPSGETYIVPYEGEIDGDPSRSEGTLPLQLGGEIFAYRIAGNRVVAVLGDGPVARAEWAEMEREPGYRNVAELGLGILADYGIAPVGELLLDEKLGLHVAFGRSDHFGGVTGAAQFSAPEKVVHIDRVYIPEVQPDVHVRAVDLHMKGGAIVPLLRDGRWVKRP